MGSSPSPLRLIKQLIYIFLYNFITEEVCRMGKCQSVLELEMVSFQPKVMHVCVCMSWRKMEVILSVDYLDAVE